MSSEQHYCNHQLHHHEHGPEHVHHHDINCACLKEGHLIGSEHARQHEIHHGCQSGECANASKACASELLFNLSFINSKNKPLNFIFYIF